MKKSTILKVFGSDSEHPMDALSGVIEEVQAQGLLVEVIYEALNQMKKKGTSPLLAMQIAAEDWDINVY